VGDFVRTEGVVSGRGTGIGNIDWGPGVGVAKTGSEFTAMAGLITFASNWARRDGCIERRDSGRVGIDEVEVPRGSCSDAARVYVGSDGMGSE
jgi:hypothetical protein